MIKTKFRFSIFGLSHRLCRGSEVTVGAEDQLQKKFTGHFYSGGVKWKTFCLTMANLKLKPFLFTLRPIVQSRSTKCNGTFIIACHAAL